MATLTLKAGDTIARTITIKDSSGNVVILTGATVYIKIAKTEFDKDADAIYYAAITPSDPTHGIAPLNISSTISTTWNMGDYKWQVWYVDVSTSKKHSKVGPCIIEKTMSTNG